MLDIVFNCSTHYLAATLHNEHNGSITCLSEVHPSSSIAKTMPPWAARDSAVIGIMKKSLHYYWLRPTIISSTAR